MHAESKWPDVITANLWPYALRGANESLNSTPNKMTGKIAHQMFSNTDTPIMVRHFHPFGCPTYVLNDNLAAGKSIPKWHKRARLGVYLGRSPNHAQSIALVLNLSTGLVSPQFHLKFDDLFESVKGGGTYPNHWKVAAHYKRQGRGNQRKAVEDNWEPQRERRANATAPKATPTVEFEATDEGTQPQGGIDPTGETGENRTRARQGQTAVEVSHPEAPPIETPTRR